MEIIASNVESWVKYGNFSKEDNKYYEKLCTKVQDINNELIAKIKHRKPTFWDKIVEVIIEFKNIIIDLLPTPKIIKKILKGKKHLKHSKIGISNIQYINDLIRLICKLR